MANDFKMIIYASLFAALTAAGAYITLPIGPIPIVLQNLFVLIAGLALGGRWGAASIGIYLIAGAVGLPVFAGGTAGIGKFAGPTGGYLIGFLFAAYITGVISSVKKNTFFDILAMIIGSAVIYTFGVIWLKIIMKISLEKALILGCYPFIIGDIVKIAAAAYIIKKIRKIIKL